MMGNLCASVKRFRIPLTVAETDQSHMAIEMNCGMAKSGSNCNLMIILSHQHYQGPFSPQRSDLRLSANTYIMLDALGYSPRIFTYTNHHVSGLEKRYIVLLSSTCVRPCTHRPNHDLDRSGLRGMECRIFSHVNTASSTRCVVCLKPGKHLRAALPVLYTKHHLSLQCRPRRTSRKCNCRRQIDAEMERMASFACWASNDPYSQVQ